MLHQQALLQGTDQLSMQGGAGSAAAVGLTGCQQACEMAQPDCDAIAYNAKLQACFLKQDPSDDTCQVGSCFAHSIMLRNHFRQILLHYFAKFDMTARCMIVTACCVAESVH